MYICLCPLGIIVNVVQLLLQGVRLSDLLKIVSEYDQENITIINRRQPHGTAWKSHSTITRHQEDKFSKATSSLFPIQDDCNTRMDIK